MVFRARLLSTETDSKHNALPASAISPRFAWNWSNGQGLSCKGMFCWEVLCCRQVSFALVNPHKKKPSAERFEKEAKTRAHSVKKKHTLSG